MENNKKVAVITGGSKGIGYACVKAFLNENYIVVNASRHDHHPFDDSAYYFIKTDVSKEEDVNRLHKEVISRFGKADVLINNAGFGKFAKLEDSTTEDFDDMFGVNVRGLYLCSRYFVKSMIEMKGGTIINISSIAGKAAIPTASIYAATKHAVMAISQALMLEVRQHGVRVSCVCPGSVDTDFFDNPGTVLTSKRETILSPEDVAEACMLIVNLPARALMNEVEIRPANPQKE